MKYSREGKSRNVCRHIKGERDFVEKSIKQTYDKLSDTYEKDIDKSSPYNTLYERPAMMGRFPERLDGMNVLDAGCAAGWYSEALADRGADVTGIDISEEMIGAATKRAGEKANFLVHDLTEKLPFRDQSFDWVISSLTLHYVENWDLVLSEFHRVLKPGGRLLYSIHHPFMDFHEFKRPDYFAREMLTDTWVKPNITIDVSFYRRPLQEIITSTSKYFSVEHVIEPQPVERLKDEDQKTFDKLMKTPHFLIIESAKKG